MQDLKNNEKNITEIVINDTESTTEKKAYLCVVMPAYNEAEHIRDNLLKTSDIISTFINNYQIIVVNDGSSDNTYEEIKKAAKADSHITPISYKKNKGKGHAISTGVNYADAEYIAFLDSDLELSPVMLRYFLKALQATKADIAIGSKLHPKSKLHYPLSRKIMSFGYYIMLKALFRLNLKDTQTGIKLFKGDIIKPICQQISTSGFAYDIEILAIASKQGLKIIEMPIELNYSRSTKNRSKISFKKIFDVFRDTLRIKKKLKKFNH